MNPTIMSDLTQMAIDLVGAGISVMPLRENKKPIGKWGHLQDELMSEDQILECFSSREVYGVAAICGKVSGGLECIDFDAHEKNIEDIARAWYSDQGVADILKRNKLYIERSPRGGYHIIYQYENDKYPGGEKLALWPNKQSMIETKSDGGYVMVAPSPGYVVVKNSLLDLHPITWDEREYLLAKARVFNQYHGGNGHGTRADVDAVKGFDGDDPISWFNWNKAEYAKNLLIEKGWVKVSYNEKEGVEYWRRPGKDDGTSATWGKKFNCLYVFSTSVAEFKNECYYTPFQILTKLRFKDEYTSAIKWILNKYFESDVPYIRVGTSYYKIISKTDRFGIERTELKVWNKDEIKLDEGAKYLDKIPKFDDFAIDPDNFNYRPVLSNCYNLYKEFSHKPSPGTWPWTEILLRHVFGEQYDLGIRYMQALYLHPKRMLPILVVVSRERQTGKTTLLNWMNIIFGDNMVNISPGDLSNSFNHIYATSNIIGIEETLIEKALTVEKLKALATGKFISVNQKFVSQYKIPFYGKIILASNNEDKFARIDQEEIRFFVRKLGMPTVLNHKIEEDMITEIPAFLDYLCSLPPIDWSRDRTGFTPEEISNEMLRQVKEESRTGLYKELYDLIEDWFNNNHAETLRVLPIDVEKKWFFNNSRIDSTYIKNVIKREFLLKASDKNCRYTPFDSGEPGLNTKVGKYYEFLRENFTKDNLAQDDSTPF